MLIANAEYFDDNNLHITEEEESTSACYIESFSPWEANWLMLLRVLHCVSNLSASGVRAAHSVINETTKQNKGVIKGEGARTTNQVSEDRTEKVHAPECFIPALYEVIKRHCAAGKLREPDPALITEELNWNMREYSEQIRLPAPTIRE